MRAFRAGVVVVLGLTLLPALAGAAPGDRKDVVFVSADGLRRVDPDSGESVVVRPPQCIQDGSTSYCVVGWAPAWSPDGRRIAFVHRSLLRVVDEDGGNERTLQTGVIVDPVAPRWSPDGTRIAFLGRRYSAGATYLYVIGVDGGLAEELTPVGYSAIGPAAWSPDGAQLAVAERGAAFDSSQIFVTAPDGSSRRQVTSLSRPAYALHPVWSPEGGRIAFARVSSAGSDAVATVQVDGTGETVLFVTRIAHHSPRPVQWRHDGRLLIEDLEDPARPDATDLFSVRADGAELRHLTHNVSVRAPVFSPDGNHVAFSRREPVQGGFRQALWMANADGTCERLIHPSGDTPDWRAGTSSTPLACTAARLLPPSLAYPATAPFDVRVLNDGTEPLRSMRLVATVDREQEIFVTQDGEACPLDGGIVRCVLPELRRGEVATLRVEVKARVLTLRGRGYERVAVGFELEPFAQRFETDSYFQTCSPGDPGEGRIRGTAWSDTICGRTGRDAIYGEWGSDVIDGGRGDDRIEAAGGADALYGGPGNDVLLAGAGRDRVYARDRARDRISCGTGRDVVVVDRGDRVARNCERVSRR